MEIDPTPTAADLEARPNTVNMPAPTAWPVLLAVGLTLAAAGLLSTMVFTEVGGVLVLISAVGWFRQVLPHDNHRPLAVHRQAVTIATGRTLAPRPQHGLLADSAELPVSGHPIAVGIKAGLAGSAAMAALSMLYGAFSHYGIWYAVNLLGAVVDARVRIGTPELENFNLELLIVGLALHLTTCILVGLFYSAFLPMLSRDPSRPPTAGVAMPLLLLAGIVAPLAWSGLVRIVLDVIDPVLYSHINWPWFLVAQIGFGFAAGWVVLRQAWPLHKGAGAGAGAGNGP